MSGGHDMTKKTDNTYAQHIQITPLLFKMQFKI